MSEDPVLEDILAFIEVHIAQSGYSPSYREIAQAVDIPSTATVAKCLNRLRSAGRVTWQSGSARTLRVKESR